MSETLNPMVTPAPAAPPAPLAPAAPAAAPTSVIMPAPAWSPLVAPPPAVPAAAVHLAFAPSAKVANSGHLAGNILPVTSVRRPWGAMLAVASVFVALVGLFIIYFVNTTTHSRIKSQEGAIAQVQNLLQNPPLADTDKTVKTISAALAGYTGKIDQQLDYALIVEALPSLLPSSVTLDSLVIDQKGSLKLSGVAPNFDLVGKLRLSLVGSPLLQDVQVDSLNLSQEKGTVSFTGQATINLDKLKKSVNSGSVSLSSVNSALVSPSPNSVNKPPINN